MKTTSSHRQAKAKTRGGRLLRLGLFVCCLSIPAMGASVAVHAQDAVSQDSQSRLQRIENEIDTLSRAVFKGEQPPAGQALPGSSSGGQPAAALELRITQIERELSALNGRFEQQTYEFRQMQVRLDNALSDIQARLSVLEGDGSGMSAQRPSSSVSAPQAGAVPLTPASSAQDMDSMKYIPPKAADIKATELGIADLKSEDLKSDDMNAPAPETLPTVQTLGTLPGAAAAEGGDSNPNPADLYERAFSLLKDKQYDEAEKLFTAFLDRYPSHTLSPNAKYWLGETYYVRGNFERAARVFAEAYQQYPKGPKGADSLLKLGMSLAGLGKKDDACLTYAQLRREYPEGYAPVLSRAQGEMEKLGCH